jgi:hypothetical protein
LVTHGSDPKYNYNPDAEYATSVDESWPISPEAPWIAVRNKFILYFSMV